MSPCVFVCLGLGLAAGGLHAIVTREIRFRHRRMPDDVYRGCAAMLMGAALALAGGGVMAIGLLLFQGVAQAVWQFTLRRPGFLLLFIGAALLAYGSAFILGRKTSATSRAGTLFSACPSGWAA